MIVIVCLINKKNAANPCCIRIYGVLEFWKLYRHYPIEQVVALDKPHDLAILQARIAAPALTLGNSDTVKIGEPVYVTGNPDGYIGSFSTGVVAAIRPGDELVADRVLQITAPVSAGSSGGPC